MLEFDGVFKGQDEKKYEERTRDRIYEIQFKHRIYDLPEVLTPL